MRFMPVLLAAMAFALTLALFSTSGVGAYIGLGPGVGEAQIEGAAEELEGEDGDIESELEPEEGASAGLLGDVVAATRGALSIGGMVLWMPSTLESIGMPGYAARIFGHAFQILLGLWIFQILRGTELL